MKKNTLIALFAILTLTLGGCSEKAEPAADTATTAETTIEQTITDEETAEETTEEAVATEEITEEVTTEETTTAAPETTTEEVTTTEEITTAPETTPVEITTEEITAEVTTKAPEVTTEELVIESNEYPTYQFYGKPEKYNFRENCMDLFAREAGFKEDGTFFVTCYVANGFYNDKILTDIPKFTIKDNNGTQFISCSFPSVNLKVSARSYVTHTFNINGDIMQDVDISNISISYSLNHPDVNTQQTEAPVTSLATASQTVMGGKVKVTAEKKSNNTIVLTIENNFEKEVSTFGYPQIKVNGMTQDLDKHLQLQNGTQSLSVPAGEKGQITYYVSDVNSVEALIGSLHSMAPSVKDKDFKLVF